MVNRGPRAPEHECEACAHNGGRRGGPSSHSGGEFRRAQASGTGGAGLCYQLPRSHDLYILSRCIEEHMHACGWMSSHACGGTLNKRLSTPRSRIRATRNREAAVAHGDWIMCGLRQSRCSCGPKHQPFDAHAEECGCADRAPLTASLPPASTRVQMQEHHITTVGVEQSLPRPATVARPQPHDRLDR